MGLNKITFNRTEGGLGRPLPSQDNYSGMIFYHDTLPSGFGSSDRIKRIFNIEDAENLGIVDDHSDETAASGGNIQVTTKGATGNVETISLDTAVLGQYTILATDTTPDDVATGLRAAINALTIKHGYTAAGAGANVAITPPTGLGKSINTGEAALAFSSSGTGVATVTQFSSGVGSYFRIMHYHISEFFRMQPQGNLWVAIYAQGTFDGSEIQTVQDFANGEIRQFGVFLSHETFATSQLTAIQSVTTTLRTNKKPCAVLFHSDFTGSSLSSLSNLTTLTASDTNTIISEDGNWHYADYSNTKKYIKGDKINWAGGIYQAKSSSTGNAPYENDYWSFIDENLADISQFTISDLGTALGTVAFAFVHENIAWIEKFDISNGKFLEEAAFVTGDLYKNQTTSLLDTINDYHYIFTRNFVGKSGTYFNDSWTAIARTSDFATLENNRTLDKAERLIYANMLNKLASPIYVNSDGTLTEDTISIFENVCARSLDQMERDAEVSGVAITIDPSQDVLTTSKIVISVLLQPVGVARIIEINSGFTTQIV